MVYCKGKGRIDGGEHKGGETQEGQERGGGMCKYYGGKEEVPSSI